MQQIMKCYLESRWSSHFYWEEHIYFFQYRTKFCASFLNISNVLSNKTTKFKVCDISSVKKVIKFQLVRLIQDK